MVDLVAPVTGPIFQTRAVLLLVESVLLALIGVGLVLLRVRDAWKLRTPWRADLILVCIATTFALILFIPGLMAGLNGFGTQQDLLSPLQITDALIWSDVLVAAWIWAICFCKLAIIALYSRVTQAAIRSERAVLWCIGVVTILCAVIQDILLFATRHQHSTDLDEMYVLLAKERRPYIHFSIVQGALSAVIDIVLMVYPIPIVAKMKCSRTTKMSLYGVIAAGILPTAAVIGRTVILPSMLEFSNATETWVPVFCWASAEVWLMIILGSLPPLRAYFARLLKLDEKQSRVIDDTVLMDTMGQMSTVIVQDMTKSKNNWEIV